MGYNGTRRKSSMCITPSLYLATCSISQFQEKSVFTIVGCCLISIRMNYAATLPPLFRSTIVCSWAQRLWNRVMLSLMSCSKHGALPGGWRTDTLNAEYSLCCRPMGAPRGRHIQAPAAKAWQKEWAFLLLWKWWLYTEALHNLQPYDPSHKETC